jgi:gamma-aminobutyric acid receptor subunit alpha
MFRLPVLAAQLLLTKKAHPMSEAKSRERAASLRSIRWIVFSLVVLSWPLASAAAQAPKRPGKTPPSVDSPTKVSLGFYVLNLGKLDQTNETVDIAGLVTTSWVDKRLEFDPSDVGENVIRYTPDQIWVPELTIVNSANLQRRTLIQLFAKPDGTVKWVEYIYVTVSSSYNLRKFPFDSQTGIIIWEPLSSEVQRIELVGNPIADGVSKDDYVGLSEWDIQGVETKFETRKAEKEDISFPRCTFSMHLQRNYAFYLLKVAMPLLLITIISWTATWINPSTAFVVQMNVGIISMLAAITFNLAIMGALPRVPYTTLMDGFIGTCFLFFFISILATVYVHYLINNRPKPDPALSLIRKLRWILPLAFIIIQAVSFAYFELR